MTRWVMKKKCKFNGRTVYMAHQNEPGGLALWPPAKFNTALRFIRKYAHIDVDKVLRGEQELPE